MKKLCLIAIFAMAIMLLPIVAPEAKVHAVTSQKGKAALDLTTYYVGDIGWGPIDADPGVAYDTASGELLFNTNEPLIEFKGEVYYNFTPVLALNVPDRDNIVMTVTNTTNLFEGVHSPTGAGFSFVYGNSTELGPFVGTGWVDQSGDGMFDSGDTIYLSDGTAWRTWTADTVTYDTTVTLSLWRGSYTFHIRTTDAYGNPINFHNCTGAVQGTFSIADVKYSYSWYEVTDLSSSPIWIYDKALFNDGTYHAYWRQNETNLGNPNAADHPNMMDLAHLIDNAFEISDNDFIMNVGARFPDNALKQTLASTWSDIISKDYAINNLGCWNGNLFDTSKYAQSPTAVSTRIPGRKAPALQYPGTGCLEYPDWWMDWARFSDKTLDPMDRPLQPDRYCGTGPYYMQTINSSGYEVILKRNSGYWRRWPANPGPDEVQGGYYQLAIEPSSYGTTDVPTDFYPDGTEIAVTALPNLGYVFDHWVLDGDNVAGNPITVTTSKNHVLTPVFAYVGFYALVVTRVTGGHTDHDGVGLFTAGTNVDVTEFPDLRYFFDHWVLDGGDVGGIPTRITMTMSQNHYLTPVFIPGFQGPYCGGSVNSYVSTVHIYYIASDLDREGELQAGVLDAAAIPISDMPLMVGLNGEPTTPTVKTTKNINPEIQLDANMFCFNIANTSVYCYTGKLPDGIPGNFFNNAFVRKAFAYSFNQTQYITQAWRGEASNRGNPFVLGLYPDYYNSSYNMPSQGGIGYDINYRAAYNCLTNATWTDPDTLVTKTVWQWGFKFDLSYNSGNTMRQIACQMIIDFFTTLQTMYGSDPSGIGPAGWFDIRLKEISWDTFVGDYLAMNLPMFDIGWLADFADADDFVRPYMHSNGALASFQNYTAANGWGTEKDTLIDQALLTDDSYPAGKAARQALYYRCQQIYYNDCPSFPVATPNGRRWCNYWVKGWYYDALYPGDYFYGLWKQDTPWYDVSGTLAGVSDGKTNMKDIAYLIAHFNAKAPTATLWDARWVGVYGANGCVDPHGDRTCNMKDIAGAVVHFNRNAPGNP